MGLTTLSMGAGVQTTAVLLKFYDKYDYIIFADTGDEKPETYWYIDKYLKPFCKEKGVEWVTVRHKDGISLMDYCIKRKLVPLKQRRWCTMHWKVKPIHRFLREHGATRNDPAHVHIGISTDEAHRANFSRHDPKYIVKHFPLIDAHMSRGDCRDIISSYGWPVPEKSGCDFCMFNGRKYFKKMSISRPKRFGEVVQMERNSSGFDKGRFLLEKFSLDGIAKSRSMLEFIGDDDEESCGTGHCMR